MKHDPSFQPGDQRDHHTAKKKPKNKPAHDDVTRKAYTISQQGGHLVIERRYGLVRRPQYTGLFIALFDEGIVHWMKHSLMMVVGCGLALLLIFLLPAMGLGSGWLLPPDVLRHAQR